MEGCERVRKIQARWVSVLSPTVKGWERSRKTEREVKGGTLPRVRKQTAAEHTVSEKKGGSIEGGQTTGKKPDERDDEQGEKTDKEKSARTRHTQSVHIYPKRSCATLPTAASPRRSNPIGERRRLPLIVLSCSS